MAIATDADSSGTPTGSATSISWSHTCAAGAVLVVTCGWQGSTDTTGATYNGVAMTQLYSVNDSAFGNVARTAGFILKNPASGANTVQVNFATAADLLGAAARSYTGVDTTTPNRTVYTDNAGTNVIDVVVADSANGDVVVASGCVFAAGITCDQTLIFEDDQIIGGATSWAFEETAATGANTTMSFSGTFTGDSIGATALIPSGAGGGGGDVAWLPVQVSVKGRGAGVVPSGFTPPSRVD